MARLVLVGLPGTGKSSVARALSEAWGCDFLDTDEVLSASMGTSAADYLRRHGEAEFRRREIEALRSALESDAVVATGGGAVVTEEARRILAAERTIWLDCDDEAILRRLGDGERPLLEGDPAGALARLRAERTGWYREVASERVDASGPLADVVARVLAVVA